MIARDLRSMIGEDQETDCMLVTITRVPNDWGPKETRRATLSATEEEECERYGYTTRLPINITGETEKRATNIVLVGGVRVPIGDVPFALFLRLVIELLKNKYGAVSKSVLIRSGYIKADGEFQAIARLRQSFSTTLDGRKPEKFIESCEHRSLRLSTHPGLVNYDKGKLLLHRYEKIRRLAQRLP